MARGPSGCRPGSVCKLLRPKAPDDRPFLLHGFQVWQMATELPPIGATLRLMPGHCDPTVNLYDWIVATRGERVEAVWRIRGRGPGI